MKIYLDNNLGVTNVEQEELTQDTIGYNILKVYIPNTVLTPYDTFTCYYGALLQNGRKVGWFAMEARTSSDADYEANYTLYKATLEQCVVSVEGKVYIGCQVLLGNSGNATLIKKNTAVVQFNVRKSVAINNDILILDTDQTTTDVLESYKNLLENALTTYATKAEVYTKTQIDALLLQKADKSDTYTKTEVDVKDLNLAAQMVSDKLELNNRINTTNNILVETNAKVASLETDVDTLQNNTYSKTEVDEKIDDISAYTKSEIDTMINAKADKTTVEGINTRVGALETDIADLKSVQNVVEVVATKSALNSYDTTKLDVNDKVQVIADETHDGASTIYNWSGSAWVYVGAFGGNSYTKATTYTKTEVNSALALKADKSDTYTKTEVDNTFAPKSTAITHTDSQLQDYSGNNVYPNLDDGQVTEENLDNNLQVIINDVKGRILVENQIDCYVDDKSTFTSYTGPNQYWGYNTPIHKNTLIKSLNFRCVANSKLTIYLCSLNNNVYSIEHTIPEATYSNSNNIVNVGYYTNNKEIYVIFKGGNVGGLYYSSTNNGTGRLVNYTLSGSDLVVSQSLNKWQYSVSYNIQTFKVPNSVIKVAKDGTCDYKTINEALTYAYTIESVNNPITIIIYPGVYKEVCNVKGTHFVSLVGVNRDTCIIRDDTGIYNNCPLRIEGASYIANLTLIATHSKTNDFVVDGELQYNASYALHIDDRHADNDNDYRVTVFNCRCYSEQNPAVGIGLDKNTTLELIQCEFERNETVTITSVKSGVWGYKADGGAFFYHALYSGHYTDDTGYQRMTVKDCVLKNNKNYCIYGESGGLMQYVETTFINNVGYSANGFTAHRLSGETLQPLSYGNNMASLNYTE